jgi:peptidoglycan/LPS O-acetylase OafA/YrhL
MRIKELDGLRGLAALSVVLFHYTNGSNPYSDDVIFFEFGHYGVELFFIISGFVISLTLKRKKTFIDFWKARFFRLFPIYWFCMTLTFVVTSLIGLDYMTRSFTEYVLNAPMLSRFIGVKFVDGAYWSLQYELFFYLLMALIYYFFTKSLNKILIIFGLLTVVQFLINITSFNAIMENYGGLASTVYFRLYGILFIEYIHLFTIGIALYAVVVEKKSWAWIYIVLGVLSSISISVEDFIATSVIMGIFISALWWKWKIWRNRIMLWLGAISYVLYLIHMFMGRSLIMLLVEHGMPVYPAILIVICFIIALASLIHSFIEKPVYNSLTGRKPSLISPTRKDA